MGSEAAPTAAAKVLVYAQRVQALAQAGLAFSTGSYDLERYQELRDLSVKLLAELTDEPLEKIVCVFASETGYQTPKVDVRAFVLRDTGEILLVSEKSDGNRWTLPGGWADVGYTPFETAVKEVREETGLDVQALRLLALLDKRMHAHPPQPWYVYKAFVLCREVGGKLLADTPETVGARWFRREQLEGLPLSRDRVLPEQIETLFRLAADPTSQTMCD